MEQDKSLIKKLLEKSRKLKSDLDDYMVEEYLSKDPENKWKAAGAAGVSAVTDMILPDDELDLALSAMGPVAKAGKLGKVIDITEKLPASKIKKISDKMPKYVADQLKEDIKLAKKSGVPFDYIKGKNKMNEIAEAHNAKIDRAAKMKYEGGYDTPDVSNLVSSNIDNIRKYDKNYEIFKKKYNLDDDQFERLFERTKRQYPDSDRVWTVSEFENALGDDVLELLD